MDIGSISVGLGVNISNFERNLNTADNKLSSFTAKASIHMSGFSSGVSKAGSGLSGFSSIAGSALGLATTGLMAVGGAALQMGMDSVQAAASFESTMNKVQALAGVSEEGAKKAEQAIMSMATEIGQTPQQLAEGFYYVASAGFEAEDALKILELSGKGAAIGMTDTEVVADALTASLKALGLDASESQKIMDQMIATVSTGKTEFEDYAKVAGKLAVSAKGAGVAFEEANAAFAVMTNISSSSRQAALDVTALLNTSSRFDLLADRAAGLGIAFDQTAYESMSLTDRMRYLMEVTDGDKNKLNSLLGQVNATRAILGLSTNDFADFNTALEKIGNSAGSTDKAFEKVSQGFEQQMAKLNASWEVLKVTLGSAILPLITPILEKLTPIVTAITDWASKNIDLGASFNALGEMLKPLQEAWGPVFTDLFNFFSEAPAKFQPLAEAIQKDLLPPIMDLAAQIAPLVQDVIKWMEENHVLENSVTVLSEIVSGLGEAIKFLSPFILDALKAVGEFAGGIYERLVPVMENLKIYWDMYWPAISTVLEGVWGVIVGIVQIAWAIVEGIINIGLDILAGDWQKAWDDLVKMLEKIWEGIKTLVEGQLKVVAGVIMTAGTAVLDAIMGPFDDSKKKIQEFMDWVKNQLGKIGENVSNTLHDWGVPGFARGVQNFHSPIGSGSVGIVGEEGPELMFIPNGSSIFPTGSFPSNMTSFPTINNTNSPSSDGTQYIYILLDGKTIGEAAGSRQAKTIRVRTGRRVA